MKFHFLPKQSKIKDFLWFPKFLYQKDIFLESSHLNNHRQSIELTFLDDLDRYQKLLTPFAKEIELFYHKDFNDFDYIDCFQYALPIYEVEQIKDYLTLLTKLDNRTIRRYIIDFLNEENEIKDKTLALEATNEEIMTFLDTLDLDPQFKWNLFLMVQEPKKYLDRYLKMMTTLLPIFESIYAPYEEEVIAYGSYLENYLNQYGEKGLEELTQSLINKTYFINETSRLLVSPLYAYTFMVRDNPLLNEVLWGLKVESSFKRIKEINEDKLNERVQIFKNLGDKTKYEVLKYISQGITSTKELARLTNVSSATISYHINSFLTTKMIKLDNSNKKFSYVVNYSLLDELWKDFKKDLDN